MTFSRCLRQLESSLEKKTINGRDKTDTTSMTESSTKKDAEDHLKTVNKQVLVLPGIDDFHRKAKIPKWKPPLQSIPDVRPQRGDFPAGEKQKRLLHHPAYRRTIMPQKLRISLPDVHERSTNTAKHHRIITGPAVSLPASELKASHSLATAEEHMGTGSKSKFHKQAGPGSTCTGADRVGSPPWTAKTPPPSITSRCVDHRDVMRGSAELSPESPQNIHEQAPVIMSRYPFTVREGRIDSVARDFCHFKQSFSSCWSTVADALETLEKLLRDFAVPLAKVSGELLVQFAHGRDNGWRKAPLVNCLLSVLENWEEVAGLVSRPGQRYKGEGGTEAAAIRIQTCWRRYFARTAYLRHCQRKWAAMTIAVSWLMYSQVRLVKKTLQARRFRQLENHRSRAQHLAANWKHIQSSKRTIIHIPSLGYSESQRRSMRGFDVLQNIQISRLFDIRDENVEVIYVCPRHLGDDIMNYYASLLKCDGGARDGTDTGKTRASSCSRRFLILTPEAVDYFPNHNMCLSTLLKYSPCALKRIKNLIQGKQAYIVSGVAHVDDLAVADELGVPILGPEPAVAQHYSTKSGGRRIFIEAEVDVPLGQGDIYTLNQLHETLAELMAQNMNVQRWLFKINSEHGGRGTAYCDLCHLSCYNWALHEYHRHGPQLWKVKWIQESVMLRYLDEIPEWLGRHARPAKTSRYPNWACFLKIFLRQGGVVEAYPPSDLVTCVTVDLLLEPGGEVTMLSCGDQLHGSCPLETVGSTVPQTSVHPETLLPLCRRVGQACLRRSIVGYVSVDLATFLNHNTMEQKVWAIDLDLTYSDQLAMTQMLLMMTGGTMNCRTGCLEVPMPARERCCEDQIATKPPVVNRYAVIGSHLFHSNLSILCHAGFLMICKFNGIGFNMKSKQGTVFTLYDDSWRWNMGMITVSEDLQGALVTFARNLSFIHQEISTSKMQGETNFKELIKDVEDVLQRTVQNKMRAVEDKPAA